MKSPLRKLRGFTFHKHEDKSKKASKLDELVEAAKDMQDLRNCYEGILSAAATVANNAYELSEALEELGTCFLEKTALTDEENDGRALIMLGKVHFELQKLFSRYRAHVYQTMVKPSKSLIGELEILEEMKIQCDNKRDAYKSMLMNRKERGRSKNAKGETATLKELQEAQADYEEEATLFVFRLKSLKQGQFRSILTQAARHHAAQLCFFRKGLEALEAVEPHIKAVADQQHIEYQFSELEDDGSNYDDNDDDSDDNYDGELRSFDYNNNRQDQDVIPISRSFEEENTDRSQSSYNFSSRTGIGSQSAPISVDGKGDVSEKPKPLQPSSRKFESYALPIPNTDVNSISASPNDVGIKDKWWYSSPLEAKIPTKDSEIQQLNPAKSQTKYPARKVGIAHSGPIPINAYSVHPEGLSFTQPNPLSDAKNFNRQAFSGPLKPKPYASKPGYSVGDYETTVKVPPVVSMAAPHQKSQNQSSATQPQLRSSPPPTSIPKINELHELPRPPVNLVKTSPSSLIGYSGPLISRGQVFTSGNKPQLDVSSKLSPLPTPPHTMTRSFSIPTRSERMSALSVAKMVDVHGDLDSTEEVASPALMPSSAVTDKVSAVGETK